MLADGRGGGPGSPSSYHRDYRHPPHRHYYKQQQTPSPPSSPSSSCCSLRRGGGGKGCCGNGGGASSRGGRSKRRVVSWCCCCIPCPAPSSAASAASTASSVFTSLGICLLVLGYTLLGAFTFMALEGGLTTGVGSSTHTQNGGKAAGVGTVTGGGLLGEDIRSRTVEKLWSITEDLNILYKDNWTRLAAQEVLKFQDTLVRNLRGSAGGGAVMRSGPGANGGGSAVFYSAHHHRWSFSSSFLYSLTLITTIGYGSVTPRTPWGKVVTIAYALVGIPLMLVYLSTVGDVLARSFRRLYARLCGAAAGHSSPKSKLPEGGGYLAAPHHKGLNNIAADGKVHFPHHHHSAENDDFCKSDRSVVVLDCGGEGIAASSVTPLDPQQHQHQQPVTQVRVPVSLCLAIVFAYICAGALLFNRLENWTFLEGSFFCFTSLGTIGFGDLVPGLHQQLSIFASSAYILLGMALVAMCFNLIQDEVVLLVRRLARHFGVRGSGSNSSPSSGGDDDAADVGTGESIAMSVVSTSTATS